ncbi:MAG: VOC family protein [Myxococcales bacterium]|jgi:predicted 3-demethylubiquinone-9 3-methyltransferase (glyoxalase superfamily)
MDAHPIVPCIWLDNQAEQAAELYTKTFREGRIVAVSRFPESSDNAAGKPRGSVLTVEIEIAGERFSLLNGGPMFVLNPSISFFVEVPTREEVDRLYATLADGGEALMELGAYPWSERYAWVKDRNGVSWQLMQRRGGGEGQSIFPCLMFSGPQHGKAEAAMRQYTSVFPNARIESIERYAAGEGPEGTVKHGRFVIAGELMAAMDSHLAHDITFNEALSLQVMCSDQAEIDKYWAALSEGGQPGPCGWLKDRFGLSWQVVPSRLVDWVSRGDDAARARVLNALMPMGKLDLGALEAAFEGR